MSSYVTSISLIIIGLSQLVYAEDYPFTPEDIQAAATIIGLEFTATERDSMQEALNIQRQSYETLRTISLENSIPPALQFNPIPVGFTAREAIRSQIDSTLSDATLPEVTRPANLADLAFYSIRELAYLIHQREISCVELTQLYLDRLRTYGDTLQCVITLTEERALAQAKKLDAELAAGKSRGILHGIPFGAKDLLAVKGYRTTWGAMPYKDQVIDQDATVIQKLEAAGAVLVAKLTLGALAWGDVWFGGKTKNPWDLAQGSSGSSAGSAAATAAGLVPFALGSETWGSIVSPSTRCGTTGLRPTYGRVSRTGAMALSWTMDKLGPICRSADDCALVFAAIHGSDGIDQTVGDHPFSYPMNPANPIDLSALKIGYLKQAFEDTSAEYAAQQPFDQATLITLKELGAELIPIELPDYPVEAISFILSAEAAAAFDELTRMDQDDLLVRQIQNAWPNVFRASRLIPAVEYINANRLRYQIIQAMARLFEKVDLYISPSFGSNNLLLTNLTGHPCVVLPNGFDPEGHPKSITLTGNLYDEATILAVARVLQDATSYHQQHPPRFR